MTSKVSMENSEKVKPKPQFTEKQLRKAWKEASSSTRKAVNKALEAKARDE